MSEELPQPVEDFRQAAEAAGFALVEHKHGGGFNDQALRFERDPVWALIVSDRGQWFVKVGAAGWNEGFDADLWHAELEGTEPRDDARDLGRDLEYFRSVLPKIAERADDAALERLSRLAHARASKRYGIDV